MLSTPRSSDEGSDGGTPPPTPPPPLRRRLLAAGVPVLLFLLAWAALPGFREGVGTAVAHLRAGDVEALRGYLLGFGAWAPAVSAGLMVLQSLVAPLPAFVVTFANGLLFGVWWGTLLSWTSAMAAAWVCFGIARWFGRPAVRWVVPASALDETDRLFERYGGWAVFLARLIPVVAFDVVSYAAGLTAMATGTFLAATGLGMLPATVLYSWLGRSFREGVTVLLWAFAAVAVAGFVAHVVRWRRK